MWRFAGIVMMPISELDTTAGRLATVNSAMVRVPAMILRMVAVTTDAAFFPSSGRANRGSMITNSPASVSMARWLMFFSPTICTSPTSTLHVGHVSGIEFSSIEFVPGTWSWIWSSGACAASGEPCFRNRGPPCRCV